MNSLEDRLRDAYHAVTDTVREDELPELYDKRARNRRGGRVSTFAPLAAAAAVVVAIVASVAVPKLASSPSQPAVPFTSRGTPPFVLILNKPDAHGNMGPVVVVSAATGRITGRVPVPRKGTTWYDIALTGSSTTFILAATPTRGGLCNPSYLYTLTLSASGAPTSLKPWSYPVVPLEIGSITASADGGALAFMAYQCRSPDQEIGFIRGRTMKAWQEPYPLWVNFLSLSADGSVLGYTETTLGAGGKARVLDTSSAPGRLTEVSKSVFTYPAGARAPSLVIGAAGTTLYVFWMTGPDGFHLTRTMAGYRIGSGRVQGTLFRRTMPGGMSLQWAGSRLLVWDPAVAVYLVDPLTGYAKKVRGQKWTGSWEIYW